MKNEPKELLRFTQEKYDFGDLNTICVQLRAHKIAFSRPGPHWFPTILPAYELVNRQREGHCDHQQITQVNGCPRSTKDMRID